MAPRFLMLSERVLMNCLVDLMAYASQSRVSWPQKNWAMVEATMSCWRYTPTPKQDRFQDLLEAIFPYS